MNELLPSFKDTIFMPSYDLVTEYMELGIDALFDNEIVKGIPIVGTLSTICKVGYNLHERNLIKQTFDFVKGLNNGTLSQEKIGAHRAELERDPAKLEKELGRILIILGNHIENVQSRVLGGFYSAYIKGAISWEKFCELSEANRRMFANDYHVLHLAYRMGGIDINGRELYQVDRLVSLGLLQNENRVSGTKVIRFDFEEEKTYDIVVTSFGKTFCQHLPNEGDSI